MRKRRSWSTSGKDGFTIFPAMKLANTSFIQTSSNQFMVTRSPNHMCDVSWEITLARPRICDCVADSSSMIPDALYRIPPGCSIPPYWNDGMSTKSNFWKGYAMPVYSSSHFKARACRSKIASRLRATFALSVSRWNICITRPSTSASSTKKLPAAKAKR